MKKQWWKNKNYDESEMFPNKKRRPYQQGFRPNHHGPRPYQQRFAPPPYQQRFGPSPYQQRFGPPPYQEQQRFGRAPQMEVRNSHDTNALQMENEALHQEIRRLKKVEEDRKRQEEIDAKAQSQSFCPFGDDDDSSDDGGAPVSRGNRSNKRRNPSPPWHSPSKKVKSEKFEQIYRCLEHLNVSLPETVTDVEKERVEYTEANCDLFREARNGYKQRERLSNFSTTLGMVESIFPPKLPSSDPSNRNVFLLEGAPYDRRNDASVALGTENNDWNKMSYEEFKALTVTESNSFHLSSAKTKRDIYMERINKSRNVIEKVECYVNMINLEEALTEERRATGEISGSVDVDAVKLAMVRNALENCGNNIELRLLEIEILTSKYGANSQNVKDAWNVLLSKFPNDLEMWRHRLTYFRNKRSLFNARTYIKEHIFKCLERLGGIINGTFKSHPEQPGTHEFVTDVIVAAASLYIELGAVHKAIGILQALVEFFILTPTTVQSFNFKRKLESFENFWKTAIPKAGDENAKGWNKVVTNGSFELYDYPENGVLSKESEEGIHQANLADVFTQNIAFCQAHAYESDFYMWQAVEKDRTEKLWKPCYNSATSSFYDTYNSFDSIKPYLIQLPKKVVEDAIYKVLIKLGAVIPGVKDYSHEGIYEKYFFEDATFKMVYAGMDKFIDNILLLISGADKDHYLFATIARLTTAQAYILKSKKTYRVAKEEFVKHLKYVFLSVTNIRSLEEQEKMVINSYAFQLDEQMRQQYKAAEDPIKANELRFFSNCPNVFNPIHSKLTILYALRHFVMICRKLPHYEGKETPNMTKLQFLVKLTSLDRDIDFRSKDVQEKAIQQWKSAGFHTTTYALPAGTQWMGQINTYALELLSILIYEAEDDSTSKLQKFKENFQEHVLKLDEDLAEIYFNVWKRHVEHYNVVKDEFLEKLNDFVQHFPRNDHLTMMYVSSLQRDEMELRIWFLMNNSKDDIAKGIRSVAQAGALISALLAGRSVSCKNFAFTAENITKAAEMNLTSIIPESFLWRLLLQYIHKRKPEDFKNNFLVANDRCAWSKILSLFAASLKNTLVEDIEQLAKNAAIEMKTSFEDVKREI